MPKKKTRTILQRQLDARGKLWPDLNPRSLWSMDNDGWVAVPRLMPLMMSIMDDLSGKGFPVSRAYFELWTRMRVDEGFLVLNRPEEMAFHAGFEGQRAIRTWKDRIQRLAKMGFIDCRAGPLGELSYVAVLNPYHVIKRAHLAGQVQDHKWQALVVRANEVSAFDLDDLGDQGELLNGEEEGGDAEEVAAEGEASGTAELPSAQQSSGKPSRRFGRKKEPS